MLVSEEELPVQVAEIDRVEVDDVDFAEAGADEVLEELAADATGSNHQHLGLGDGVSVGDEGADCRGAQG